MQSVGVAVQGEVCIGCRHVKDNALAPLTEPEHRVTYEATPTRHPRLSTLTHARGLMGFLTPKGVTFLSAKKDLEVRDS